MTSMVMERRTRLNWSPKRKRPWCPGLTRASDPAPAVPSGVTGMLRVHALMDLLTRRGEGQTPTPVAEPVRESPNDERPGVRD